MALCRCPERCRAGDPRPVALLEASRRSLLLWRTITGPIELERWAARIPPTPGRDRCVVPGYLEPRSTIRRGVNYVDGQPARRSSSMSLHPHASDLVPEQTARVAHAAFPRVASPSSRSSLVMTSSNSKIPEAPNAVAPFQIGVRARRMKVTFSMGVRRLDPEALADDRGVLAVHSASRNPT